MKILLVILISAVVSAVVTKIITAKHLKVIDSYLDETIEYIRSIVRESSDMNVERTDSLIEKMSDRISEVLKSNDFNGVAELTKALAELLSARASFK